MINKQQQPLRSPYRNEQEFQTFLAKIDHQQSKSSLALIAKAGVAGVAMVVAGAYVLHWVSS
ncbi:hypothetical protein VPH49_24515 [Pseudomonas luteola]|jgi:hypothetical protein|uniref:Uncharacterized protein n=1 Tax=Pseudomonas luteola TaxID=47886 RepID=A0ABS0MXJ5_PSELU|nr:hypothetical protein [Pseudomonas luteola]MBH3441443.1 hypothetical protein [Pseudomonas luteola]QEU26613.1 hypothetical protein FOB45_02005 [Pseudomonas luteola]